MSLYRQPGSDKWYVDISHRGRRVRRSTGTADRQEAQRKHDELAARLWKLKAHGKHLSDALLAWVEAKPRKPSSLRALKQVRAEYADRPLAQVTEDSIVAAFGSKAPGTYNKLAAIFRAALNIAHDRGWIEAPPQIERRTEPTVEPRYLTAQEWKALRGELPDHLRPMADFAIATGLRWSNVAGLTWERVNLATKQAWIPASTAKAGKTIAVPLSAPALAALRATGKNRKGPVFTYAGKPLKSPKTAWNKATARAGVPGFRWHDLRHTWASWHAMAGTPLDVLQQLGAWQTRQMVERYAHLAPSYVASFAGNARPVRHNSGHSRKRKAA